MTIRVKLFGLLSARIPGYDRTTGISLDVPEGATCREIARSLGLADQEAGVFSVAGILKGPNESIDSGDELHIFMPIGGG